MISQESILKSLRSLLIVIGLLFLLPPVEAQKVNLKQYILPMTATLISGATDGLNQALQFRYESLKRTFTGMNDQFWNPNQSWLNKYKNNDPAQGPRFRGSTTYLVFTTDAYHLTRFVENMFNAGAITLYITQWKHKRWYVYVIEVAAGWFINRVGFSLVYERFKRY